MIKNLTFLQATVRWDKYVRTIFMQICRDLFAELYAKLKNTDILYLQEHSLFAHAINLKLNNKLITILSEDKILSPFSLTLPKSFFSHVSSLTFKKGKDLSIIIYAQNNLNTYELKLQDCVDLKLSINLQKNFNDVFLKLFFLFLNKNKCQNSLFELIFIKKDTFCLEKYTKLKLCALTINQDRLAFSNALCDFLGLGPGLTPSGDDFILGWLFILRLYNVKHLPYISNVIADNLSLTNDISAAMLKNALSGRFNLNLIKTAELLKKINPACFEESISGIFKLENYGHSSWQDCLLGVFTALHSVRN